MQFPPFLTIRACIKLQRTSKQCVRTYRPRSAMTGVTRFTAALLHRISVFLGKSVAKTEYPHGPAALIKAAPEEELDCAWEQKPVAYTQKNLGINLPWLDTHGAGERRNWLNEEYQAALVDSDLADIAAMGISKIRSFCQMESVFRFRDGAFEPEEKYAANLDHFLERAAHYGLSVICVMANGEYEGLPADLDGNFRWNLIAGEEGVQIYGKAYAAYVNRFKHHSNIMMWEIQNEPYGMTTWSPSAIDAKITYAQVHDYLVNAYETIKPLAGNTPVGFSEMEEREQAKYQMFSSAANRSRYVDDCTDVYSMHFYRASAAQVFDFRSLTGKPKWATEVGAYNYDDPEAIGHPLPAALELYDPQENYIACVPIMKKFVNSGFELVMPWGFSANSGLVTHNPDGTHTLQKMAVYIKRELQKN